MYRDGQKAHSGFSVKQYGIFFFFSFSFWSKVVGYQENSRIAELQSPS